MAHTYGSCLYHFVFSTKDRKALIDGDWQAELWEYLGGIARSNGMRALGIGGAPDHVHILLEIPPRIAPAKGIQLVKGGSSKWVRETKSVGKGFAWQEGYGVFSVGFSQVGGHLRYIAEQGEHHRKRTFQEEYRAFLKRHRITVDERFVWG